MKTNNGQLTKRVWAGILLFLFMGSLAWNVENMYFNTFLNDMVFNEGSMGSSLTLTDAVNIMVTCSAIVAVITTFIMGTLSEKMRNRKLFISVGYIAWGIITALFGFITKENVASVFGLENTAQIVTVTAWAVIIMDMIMTFMGSTSNDSAFNAWVTDVTTPETTPKVETAFTFVGFIAMAVIMVVGSLAQGGAISYATFFIGLGAFVTIVGIIGLFLLENPQKFEDKKGENAPKTSYWADLFYGFRPSVVKENSNLYLILSSGCTFNSAFQVFFPYLFIYLGSVVVPANDELLKNIPISLIVVAVVSISAAVAGIVILMKVYAKNKAAAFIPSVLFLVIGLLVVFLAKTNLYGIVVGVAFVLIGYIVIMIQFGATVRDNIPQDKVGLFQGIRMIFLVMIPMIVGPTLGNIATKNSDVTYMENGAEKVLPTEAMFLYAAIVAALIFIPMLAFLKKDKEKALKEKN